MSEVPPRIERKHVIRGVELSMLTQAVGVAQRHGRKRLARKLQRFADDLKKMPLPDVPDDVPDEQEDEEPTR